MSVISWGGVRGTGSGPRRKNRTLTLQNKPYKGWNKEPQFRGWLMCFCCGSDRIGCSVLLLFWSLEKLTTLNRNRWKTIASSFLVLNRKIFISLQLRRNCRFPLDIHLFKLYLLTKRELLFLGRLPDSVYPIHGCQNENKFCEKLGCGYEHLVLFHHLMINDQTNMEQGDLEELIEE